MWTSEIRESAGGVMHFMPDEINRVFPEHLLHYCSINKRSVQSLINGRIWLSSPDELNDPFDSYMFPTCHEDDAGEAVRQFMEGVQGECVDESQVEAEDVGQAVLRSMEKLRSSTFGIYSLTSEIHNVLMWSHYADGHQGMALAFSAFSSDGDDHANDISDCSPVNYSGSLVSLYPLCEMNNSELLVNYLYYSLLRKHDCWQYENEWRIVRTSRWRSIEETDGVDDGHEGGGDELCDRGDSLAGDQSAGLDADVDVVDEETDEWWRSAEHPSKLSGIIFGMRTSDEDIEMIYRITKDMEGIKYYQMTQTFADRLEIYPIPVDISVR